jgi:hypothetical protein
LKTKEKRSKVKEVDWRKLESYAGMPLDQIQEKLRTCGHMLAFGKDSWAIEVVKTFDNDGGEAGLAALVSALFMKKHGSAAMAMTATGIYKDIAQELQHKELAYKVRNLEFMVYFAYRCEPSTLEWPLAWTYADARRRAGLANVMLAMAFVELCKSGGTCDAVAAFGIQRFFEDNESQRKTA